MCLARTDDKTADPLKRYEFNILMQNYLDKMFAVVLRRLDNMAVQLNCNCFELELKYETLKIK